MAREQTETTVTCPTCTAPNRSGTGFCTVCGNRLIATAICSACQVPNPSGSQSCAVCGAPLGSRLATPPGRFFRRSDSGPARRRTSADQPASDAARRPSAPGGVPGASASGATATATREIVLARSLTAPKFRRPMPRPHPAAHPTAASTEPASAAAPNALSKLVVSMIPRVLQLTLLCAVVFPFLLPAQPPRLFASLETRAFAAAIDRVPEGAPVLVSFDWEAGQVGEMEPLARAVVRRLFERRLRVISVSLSPQGPALAQRILDEEAARTGSQYGQDYVNLGYLPGNEPALVAFATDFRQALPRDYRTGEPLATLAALDGVERVADVALIVDVAADEGAPIRWIQQVGARLPVSIIAAVSAGAGPMLMPYARGDVPQLAGLLTGIGGVVEFNALIGDPQPSLWRELSAQRVGQIVLIAAIAVGNAAWLLATLRRRSQRP